MKREQAFGARPHDLDQGRSRELALVLSAQDAVARQRRIDLARVAEAAARAGLPGSELPGQACEL
jgi:hypothetical protein